MRRCNPEDQHRYIYRYEKLKFENNYFEVTVLLFTRRKRRNGVSEQGHGCGIII
jgi:hypothetical protein